MTNSELHALLVRIAARAGSPSPEDTVQDCIIELNGRGVDWTLHVNWGETQQLVKWRSSRRQRKYLPSGWSILEDDSVKEDDHEFMADEAFACATEMFTWKQTEQLRAWLDGVPAGDNYFYRRVIPRAQRNLKRNWLAA